MKRGQFVYYITHHIPNYAGENDGDYCNLPSLGFFRIRDSAYNLILQRT